MKRMQDRENSPRSKRSRSGYPGLDHESSRDRMSPDMDRRDSRGREPKPKPYRDFDHDIGPMSRGNKYHDRMGDGFGPARSEVRGPEYRSLCLSNISSKIPDAVLKDNLYHEFKKFGEFNVNVTFTGDQRVAYINFRYPEDARAAKHAKSKLIVFDRPVRVDPVFHRRRSSSPNNDMGRDYGGPSKGGYGHNSPPMQYGGRGGEGMGRGGANRRQNMGRGYISNQDNMPPPMSTSMERDNFDPQFQKDGASRKAPNEKFPYHLDHINPEDDIKATRTLFVGNLDYNIDLMELRQIFERFGAIEDIDVKRPQRGQGNAYAFLKYMNLDCAHQAKVEMSGQYIGRFQCKIGYGKVTPTTCLWVGGLGPWVTHQALEREFDRFGVIDRIEWPHGKTFAYVLYDNIDAATAACQEMRGFPFGDLNRRLRVDFADISHIISSPRPNDPPSPDGRDVSRNPQWRPPYEGPAGEHRDDWPLDDRGPSQRNSDPRDNSQGHRGRDVWEGGDRSRRPRTPDEFIDRQHKRSKSQEDKYDPKDRDVGRNRDNGRRPMHSQERDFSDGDRGDSRRFDERRISQGDKETEKALETVETVADMSKCLPAAWNGALILKSSAFPARMHVVGGNVTLVDNMMRDPSTTETPVLKVKQRLRLDQPKLEDVGRRVTGAGPRGHCILLALSGSLPHYEDTSVQQRPLKNLVTYLRQKDAAGVISLPNYDSKDKDNVGVLYAFPPCQFGYDYLMTKAPRLPPEPAVQDDYMVIVVIRGAA